MLPESDLPDIVIICQDIARLDGYRTISSLKTDPKTSNILFILLTPYSKVLGAPNVSYFALEASDFIWLTEDDFIDNMNFYLRGVL